MNDFARDVSGISALEDEVRREIYLYVSAQPAAVGRDQTAKALGIPGHQAKFHLDRLEEAGLLESDYVRLTGRSGPGAGRPAKVFRRRSGDVAVSLPSRQYELAGQLMATAIDEAASLGTPVAEALARAARNRGREIGLDASGKGTPLELASVALRQFGYEPRIEDGLVVMVNCPFHALARTHTRLVCEMNHALLQGLCEKVGELSATLEPRDGRCCVRLTGAGDPVS